MALWCDSNTNPVLGEIKNISEEVTSKVKYKGHVEIIKGRDLGENKPLQGKIKETNKDYSKKIRTILYKVALNNLNKKTKRDLCFSMCSKFLQIDELKKP